MGIIKNNKNIIAIYRGDKKVTSVFKNNNQIFGDSEPQNEDNVMYLTLNSALDNKNVRLFHKYETIEWYEVNGTKYVNTNEIGDKNIIINKGATLVKAKINTNRFNDGLFNGCTALIQCDLSRVTENVITTIRDMFYGCQYIKYIIMPSTHQNLSDAQGAFENCLQLTVIDLSNISFYGLPSFRNMFYNCSKLATITGIENWNVESVSDFSYMFYNCIALRNVDLSNWNTAMMWSTESMFENVERIGKTDWGENFIYGIENWNVSNLYNMNNMFKQSYNTQVLDLSKWNPTSLQTASYAFEGCNGLIVLRLDNFNFNNLFNYEYMFPYFNYINRLIFINEDTYQFILNNYSSLNISFDDANDKRKWIFSSAILTFDSNSVIITNKCEYLKICYSYNNDNGTIDYNGSYYNSVEGEGTGDLILIGNSNNFIISLKDDIEDISELFFHNSNLLSIEGELFSNNNIITNVSSLFYGCGQLTDVPNKLFARCKNINSFNQTFSNCTALSGNVPTDDDELPIYERSNGKEGYTIPSDTFQCFSLCNNLNDYDSIPRNWK